MTGIRLAVGADHAELRREAEGLHRRRPLDGVHDHGAGNAGRRRDQAGHVQLRRRAAEHSAGGGADFTNVGAVELTFVGVSAVDGQVSLVGLVGLTTKTADFTAYNRLSLGDRVWNDANNDGQLDAGEQGIGGVKLNLYNDVDGNNQYTPGVDTFVATTTTDGTGHYLFNDLLARQLRGAGRRGRTSTPGRRSTGCSRARASAADPDNNVDNDDNGSPLAGVKAS